MTACRTALAWLALMAMPAVMLPTTASAQDDGLAPGATPTAPVLETLDGEPVDLAEIVGTKPVLVEFWATWCAICRAIEPRFIAAHERYGDRVEFLILVAAVAQTKDQVRTHLARHPLPGRVLWDVEGRGARAFEAPGTGYILVLDATGTVVYAGTGVEQDLEAAVRKALAP